MKIFNKKLYIEGLRQTSLIGSFLIIVSTIINCYPTFNEISNYNRYKDYTVLDMYHATISEVNPLMYIISIIVPMIMLFIAFDFLSSRQACDFYHSLPIKRSTLAINFSLSALTWTFLSIIIAYLANSLLFSQLPYYILDYSFLFPEILEKIIISFLVFSGVLFGFSLTSNHLTAIGIAGIILCLPRFAISTAIFTVNYLTNDALIPGRTVNFTNIFGNYNNLLIKNITDVTIRNYSGFNQSTNFTTINESLNYLPFSFIYTFVLALVMFSLACFSFSKRKSEMAGNNASNNLMQHILRCLLVSPLCVFLVFLIGISDEYYFSDSQLISLVCLLIIGIYFTFELLTTKNAKKLLKSIPVFFIVIGYTVGYYGIIQISASNIISNTMINKNDIVSVNIELYSNSYLTLGYDSYTKELIAELDLSDGRIIDAVSASLDYYADSFNNSNYGHDVSAYYKTTINLANKSITRYLPYHQDYITQILDVLYEDDYINQTLITTLPDQNDIYISRATSFGENFDTTTTTALADVLYKEYNSLTQEQKLETIYSYNVNLIEEDMANHYSDDDFDFYSYQTSQSYSDYERLSQELYYDQYIVGNYKDVTLFEYDKDIEYAVYKNLPDYNSNDFYSVLALYTHDGYAKFLYLNEHLPLTKQFLIDSYFEKNKDDYSQLVENLANIDNEKRFVFCISSVDDSYSVSSTIVNNPLNVYAPPKFSFNQEIIDLFKLAITREPDYDNMYFITLYYNESVYNRTSKVDKILVSFTNEEYEKYLLNLDDYVTVTDATPTNYGAILSIDYAGKPLNQYDFTKD